MLGCEAVVKSGCVKERCISSKSGRSVGLVFDDVQTETGSSGVGSQSQNKTALPSPAINISITSDIISNYPELRWEKNTFCKSCRS